MRILMVCLGNICRSPMAEGIMRRLAEEHGLDWEIDSAGTGGWHKGEAPDSRAIRTARLHGIDISGQRARQFSKKDFERFDHIFAMDSTNFSDVMGMADTDEERNKVQLLLQAADPNSQRKNISDPWFDDALFEPVFVEIREACEKLIEKLRS